MSHACSRCGRKLKHFSYYTEDGLCYTCGIAVQEGKDTGKDKIPAQINLVVERIATTKAINDTQYSYLRDLDPSQRNNEYIALVDRLLADGELDAKEATMLESLHTDLGLDPTESTFIDKVVPSFYVACIRNDEALPPLPREPLTRLDIILKDDEVPHYYCNSVLKENRIETGFVAGSQGVSIKITKGVPYRVGGTRGHVTKEEQLVEISRGVLIITNKRMLLHPEGNTKPVSIPFDKILSYKCYDDGVVLSIEGREKSFVFLVDNPGHAETIGICLGFLCADD